MTEGWEGSGSDFIRRNFLGQGTGKITRKLGYSLFLPIIGKFWRLTLPGWDTPKIFFPLGLIELAFLEGWLFSLGRLFQKGLGTKKEGKALLVTLTSPFLRLGTYYLGQKGLGQGAPGRRGEFSRKPQFGQPLGGHVFSGKQGFFP